MISHVIPPEQNYPLMSDIRRDKVRFRGVGERSNNGKERLYPFRSALAVSQFKLVTPRGPCMFGFRIHVSSREILIPATICSLRNQTITNRFRFLLPPHSRTT